MKTGVAGATYTDGATLHLVPVDATRTVCGEWRIGEPPLSDRVRGDEQLCSVCESGVVQGWRLLGVR
jgi:hypothetical protein